MNNKIVNVLAIFFYLVFVNLAQAMTIDYQEGRWSEPMNGLRGRLLIEPRPKVNNSTIIGVALELLNVSDHPIMILNNPELINVELFNGAGKPFESRRDLPFDGLVPFPEWKLIQPGQSIKFAVESQSAGVPQGVIFIDLYAPGDIDRVWTPDPAVQGSEYFLRATFRQGKNLKDSPPASWNGTLDLPFVKIDEKQIDNRGEKN